MAVVLWTLLAALYLGAPLLGAGPPSARAQAQAPTVEVLGFEPGPEGAVQVVATVLDPAGTPVPDLAAEDFGAAINDQDVDVTGVTRAVDSSQGIAIVLAIDASDSMAGAPIEQAKVAAHRFLDGLAPQDSVALLTFAQAVTTLEFTQDRLAISAAIDGLATAPNTALYQATADAVTLAARSGASRRAVVLLSDGVDNGSFMTQETALAAVASGGVPIFVIGLGQQIDRGFLGQVAETSGGEFIEAPSPEALALVYQRFAELLRGQYVLTLDASDVSIDPKEPVTVRLSVSHDAVLGTAERTFPPSAPGVRIAGLPEGGRLRSATKLVAEVFSTEPVTSVSFFINHQLVHEASTPPYEYTVDPAKLGKGGHDLRVEARTAGGTVLTDETDLHIGSGGGGLSSGPVLPAAAVVIGVIAVLGVFLLWRRRGRGRPVAPQPTPGAGPPLVPPPISFERRRRSSVGADGQPWGDEAPPPLPSLDEVTGWLVTTAGPLAGQVFPVSGKPLSIGSALRCAVRLPERLSSGEEISGEEARAWVREGHLMVHFLLHLTPTGPVGGGWSILSDGDTFSIGPCTFRFEVVEHRQAAAEAPDYQAASAPTQKSPAGIPNILRERPASGDGAPSPTALSASPTPQPDEPSSPGPPTEGPWDSPPGARQADSEARQADSA